MWKLGRGPPQSLVSVAEKLCLPADLRLTNPRVPAHTPVPLGSPGFPLKTGLPTRVKEHRSCRLPVGSWNEQHVETRTGCVQSQEALDASWGFPASNGDPLLGHGIWDSRNLPPVFPKQVGFFCQSFNRNFIPNLKLHKYLFLTR